MFKQIKSLWDILTTNVQAERLKVEIKSLGMKLLELIVSPVSLRDNVMNCINKFTNE